MTVPRCAECQRDMTGWNEDEARSEFFKMWPNATALEFEQADQLCIDCYEELFEDICQ